jgi:8-oxo-dGTP pyrophosphatase MutT (NUDIX family)
MNTVSVKSYKTARCILHSEDKFLLAIHHHVKAPSRGKWGLPGGHTESGEQLEDTVRRELTEELQIKVGDLHAIGDYPHNNRWHRIYGAEYHGQIQSFDRKELQQIGWHSLEQVLDLRECSQLHAGWEYAAICEFVNILNPAELM